MLEALAEGKASSDELLGQFKVRGYTLPEVAGVDLDGAWDGDRTPFYDPLEMLDYHIDAWKGGSR
ncbi:MAG TPA: hypothetical protein GXX57_09460 [Firmicutes bacterium]|nr:hypothetical protein [Bacillota bacterium]